MLAQKRSFVCCPLSPFRHTYAPPVVLLLALLVGLVGTIHWTPVLAAAPEIDVYYTGGLAIGSGSTTPHTYDCTDFGAANIGNSGLSCVYMIYNNGSADLRNIAVTIIGAQKADFHLDSTPATTLTPGGYTYFQVTFVPTTVGTRKATVRIASNDSDENPYTFTIQGQVAPAEADIYCSSNNTLMVDGDSNPDDNNCTNFGQADVDSAALWQQFVIYNTGNDTLRNVAVTITGTGAAHYTLYNYSEATIAPGGYGSFYLYFTPKAAGVHRATVSVTSSDRDENPYTFAVKGVATPAEIQVNHDNYEITNGDRSPMRGDCTDFGPVEVNQANFCIFTIYNQGNDYLRNVSVAITGTNAAAFALPYQPADTIAPRSYGQFYLYFYPQTVGLQKAVVSITNSDSNENPYAFAIQGNATGPLTLAMTAEPATPASNFRFTTNAPGSLPSFLLDTDPQYYDSDQDGVWSTRISTGVPGGNYQVTAQVPFFWGVYGIDCDNPALIAKEGPTLSFNLTGSTGLSCTYQLKRGAMIRVQNFHDQNGNGRRNASEPYLPNWRFTLQDSNGAVSQTLNTNELGKGTFTDLPAGTYTICVEIQAGWRSTTPGGAPACYTRTVTWGNLLTLNFGNRENSLTAAEVSDSDVVATPDEVLTTPDDAELSEGDQTWLTTVEPTDATQSRRLYLPTVMR